MDGAEIEETVEVELDLKPTSHFEVSDSNDVRTDDEILAYAHEIPPPDEGFLHVCAAIDPNMSDDLKDNVWAQVCMMIEKVDLDDETVAYVACAFYCVMLEMEKFQQRPFPYSMLSILKICSVSVIEFFDKLSRWIEIATSSKKIIDHSHRIESSLSVSFVIFKKLLPIFRSLFQLVGNDSEHSFDSSDLFTIIWLMTIIMKKSLPTEDLITSFHLLLCVVEWVYKDLCFHDCEEHVDPDSVDPMMESKDGVRVLEVLCRSFDGVLLDAKHFRTHWFNQRRETILPCVDHKDLNIAANHKKYISSLNDIYQSIMLKKGELDERMFLPEDISNVFDPAFDSSAVELLRRGSTDTRFADAELLLTMSTQNCLEKLAEVKRSPVRTDAKSYVISSQQLRPLCPITQTDTSASSTQRLSGIVPSDFKLEGSALQRYCLQTKDNPLSVIELSAYMIGESLRNEFWRSWLGTHDSPLWTSLSRKPDSVPTCEEAWGQAKSTIIVSPSKRMRYEVDPNNLPHNQLPPCSAQMSFFSKLYYLASMRLSDICERIRIDERGRRMMWTVLEHILKEERSLLIDRHLDQNLLCIVYIVCKANKADVSFVDIMSHYRNQPQSHSRIYRMVRVDSSICPSNGSCRNGDVSSNESSAANSQQLRSDSEVGPSPEVPVALDGSTAIVIPTTPEPQSASEHHVDLIVYYNKVFLPRLEGFMRHLSESSTLASLTPMPTRRIPRGTPLKRSLSDKVTVVPYSQLPYMQRDVTSVRYKITQSPSRDFRAINRLLSRPRPMYRIAGAPQVAAPLLFAKY
ncbi:Retinoblastoma-associated protein B domain protein [Ostertagia ostertagi]